MYKAVDDVNIDVSLNVADARCRGLEVFVLLGPLPFRIIEILFQAPGIRVITVLIATT